MLVHFSPLLCFMAAAECECVSPLSSWCLIVCASAEIDPLFPVVHPATAAIRQTDAAHRPSFIDSRPAGVSFTLRAFVLFCVASHPLHAAFSNSDYTDGREEQGSIISRLKPDRKIPDKKGISPCSACIYLYSCLSTCSNNFIRTYRNGMSRQRHTRSINLSSDRGISYFLASALQPGDRGQIVGSV